MPNIELFTDSPIDVKVKNFARRFICPHCKCYSHPCIYRDNSDEYLCDIVNNIVKYAPVDVWKVR